MVVHSFGMQWHDFKEVGLGFHLDATYADGHGTVTNWELSIAPRRTYHGKSVQDLIDTLEEIKEEFGLKVYSEHKIDRMVIYTDNIFKIQGFFSKYITESFSDLSITLCDFFDFRPITRWADVHSAMDIARAAQTLIDTIFIPEKYFFLTPNQVPRKCISRACDSPLAAQIYPSSYFEYKLFRKALFGGIVYVPYKNLVVTDPLICLDLTSAYIYDLIVEKHCASKFVEDDVDHWEYYLESTHKTSIGSYVIEYDCVSNKISSFKDALGKKFEKGEQKVSAVLTSVDLKTLMDMAHISSIKCMWLYACDIDYLPRYVVDEVVRQYIKKVDLKGDKEAYDLQKSVVNGIFGDCIRLFDSEKDFESARKHTAMAPQWGIWCTSYAKKNLLKLANKVEGWVYSDTDSIYCFDNAHNRAVLEEYNCEVREKVKEFCELFDYDYEKLKDLGTFKIEKKIKKFKALAQKVYMYTTDDDKFHLTAAGLDQSSIQVDESLYDRRTLPVGSRTFRHVSDGDYYEDNRKGIANVITTTKIAKNCKSQY